MFLKHFKRPSLLFKVSRGFSFNNFDYNKDYFKVLGVQKTANEGQIKSAFYKLAKQYHPDLNKGNQAKFKQINEAYSVLSDSKLRKQYENARQTGSSFSQNNNFYNNSYGREGRGAQGYQYQDPFQSYRSNRSYYRNPYQEYQRWENQYNKKNNENYQSNQQRGYQSYEDFIRSFQQFQQNQAQRQSFRRNQQRQRQLYEKEIFEFRNSIRRSFMLGIFLSLLFIVLLSSRSRNPNYPYPPDQMNDYTLVDIRGSPYLQNHAYTPSQQYNYADQMGQHRGSSNIYYK